MAPAWGSRVGTSSARRQGILRSAYPHLSPHNQHGYVPTRVNALDHGDYGAVILAVAGLKPPGAGRPDHADPSYYGPRPGGFLVDRVHETSQRLDL